MDTVTDSDSQSTPPRSGAGPEGSRGVERSGGRTSSWGEVRLTQVNEKVSGSAEDKLVVYSYPNHAKPDKLTKTCWGLLLLGRTPKLYSELIVVH